MTVNNFLLEMLIVSFIITIFQFKFYQQHEHKWNYYKFFDNNAQYNIFFYIFKLFGNTLSK